MIPFHACNETALGPGRFAEKTLKSLDIVLSSLIFIAANVANETAQGAVFWQISSLDSIVI